MVARFKKKRKGKRAYNIFFSISLTAGFILVLGFLIVSNWRINKKRTEFLARIAGLKEEITSLEQRNQELKEDISQAGTEEYLEKVARERLGMKAPGEEVVVIKKEKTGEEVREEKEGFWNPIGWWQWLKSKF